MAQSSTPIWNKKLTTLFRRFDKGAKGHLTKDDIEVQIEAFKTTGYLTKEEEAEIRDTYAKLWMTFLNGNQTVTLDQWIQGHLLLVNSESSKELWNGPLKRAGSLMFKAADKGRKGAITEEEFAVYLTCLGVDGPKYAKEIFPKIDASGKGTLSEEEYLHAFYEFNYNKEDTSSDELMGPLVC
eukprot:Seg6064.1 transcript_id=Seg6064.1/GoldUCD/mRNA.D3Y31 product="Sarcoplasmic calcium-binding protein" protein_id=Seg6064.1/GoldUCD/D3Y31